MPRDKAELDLETIRLLLSRDSSSINRDTVLGGTLFHLMLIDMRCSEAFVRLLLDYGADPNYKWSGNSPLCIAVVYGQGVGIIRALVEGGAKVDQHGDLCLSLALGSNAELKVVELLLSAGADLFEADASGVSPICHALGDFDVPRFRSLLNLQDVDVNIARDGFDGSLLHSALTIDGCPPDFVKFLIDRGIIMLHNTPTPLRDALNQAEWDLKVIRQILEQDSSEVNREVEFGTTSFHAVLMDRRCSEDIVRLLLYYGAEPNHKCLSATPLAIATLFGRGVEVIRALVEAGAKVDRHDEYTLPLAVRFNTGLEVVRLLLDTGADLFEADFSGVSPLCHALGHFDVPRFRSLLDLQDVDVNIARNRFGGSLLHSALTIAGCTPDFVKFLIDRGIRVDSFDRFGDTPLHVAALNPECDPSVIDMLMRRGSLVGAKNHHGDTPLDLAVRCQRDSDVVQILLKYCLLQNPNLDWIWQEEFISIYLSYVKDCMCEQQRMTSEHVGGGRTLFQFLKTYSGTQMTRNGEGGFNIDLLLRIISDKLYPLYSNVIASKFGHSLLSDKLEECRIRSVAVEDHHKGRCVVRELNFDCAYVLAKYMDEADLLSLIMASCS